MKTIKFVSAFMFMMALTMVSIDIIVSLNEPAKSGFNDTIVETDSCRIIRSDLYTTWAVCGSDTVAVNNKHQVVTPFGYCLEHSTHYTHFHVKRAKARIVHGVTEPVSGTVDTYMWHELTAWDTFYAGDIIIIMLFLGMLFIYYSYGTWAWAFDGSDRKWHREDVIHIVCTILVIMASMLVVLFYNCGVRAEALCL